MRERLPLSTYMYVGRKETGQHEISLLSIYCAALVPFIASVSYLGSNLHTDVSTNAVITSYLSQTYIKGDSQRPLAT